MKTKLIVASLLASFNLFGDYPNDVYEKFNKIDQELLEIKYEFPEDRDLQHVKVIPSPYKEKKILCLIDDRYVYVTIYDRNGPMDKISYDPNRKFYMAVFSDKKVLKVTPIY